MMKISLEWLLAESSKLQDHRQWDSWEHGIIRTLHEDKRRQEQAVVVSLINAKNSSKTENYTELHGDTSIIISDKHTVQPILPLSEKQSGIHKKTYIFSLFSVFRSIITKILEIILWHNCWQKRQPVCKSHASKSQKFGFRLCIKCGVKTKYWKQQYDHLHELYSLHTKNSKTCHWWLINTFYSILSQQQ